MARQKQKQRPFTAGQIRLALRAYLLSHDAAAVLFDELPLCRGYGRADLVAVNGTIAGFEIKSALDSLARLPRQIVGYDALCDFTSVVLTSRHLAAAEKSIPTHWGLLLIQSIDGHPSFRILRKAERNAADITAQIRLLWKPEVVRALRTLGIPGCPTAPVVTLWQALASAPRCEVADVIRDLLKARGGCEAGRR